MSARDRSDDAEIVISPEMIDAGVDIAMTLGAENVSLDTLAIEIYRAMVFASRARYHHSYT